MEIVDILLEARNLIADRDQWTRGTFAVAADNMPVEPHSPLAIRWCAVGAIVKVCSAHGLTNPNRSVPCTGTKAIRAIESHTNGTLLHRINDDYGHDYTIDAFDTAIRFLKDHDGV